MTSADYDPGRVDSSAQHEETRLVAWASELRGAHERLREALRVTRRAIDDDGQPAAPASRDLLLYCRGFCVALDGHHQGEDRTLFPAIESAHPELRPVLQALQQDHSMIEHLVAALQVAIDDTAPRPELELHLEGIAAIMESHFRYEERQLLEVLETLDLPGGREQALGPI